MRKTKFTNEEMECLTAGHEVKKGKYTYRIHGKYVEHTWKWVFQKIGESDKD